MDMLDQRLALENLQNYVRCFPMSFIQTGNPRRRLIPLRYRPGADCMIHTGCPYFLELKRKGTHQRPDQKEFQREAEKAGALYAVVRSIDDVCALGCNFYIDSLLRSTTIARASGAHMF